MAERTTGGALNELRRRAGMSLEDVARAAGYSGRSSVQRYFEADNDRPLTAEAAAKLAGALVGKGSPPIERREIVDLTRVPETFEVEPSDVLPPRYLDLPKDVPVYATAIGTYAEDESIELASLELSDPIDYFRRPLGLATRKGVYGVYISGESQSPRFEPGELVFADPSRPAMIGDDVIVYLKRGEEDDDRVSAILIKRLIRQSAQAVHLRQFNPPQDFSVERRRVVAIHRVMTTPELWAGYK